MRNLSMSEAIRDTLSRILTTDDRSFLIGEDIGTYGGAFKITRGFVEKFGDRVIDAPISEAGFVSMACGAALMGSRPIVEIMFMDFLTLAMDGIINSAVKWSEIYGEEFGMPIVIRCPAGAGRSYGPTHSQSFEGLLMNVPGLTIICPSTPADAASLLEGAYRSKRPVIFVEPKALYAKKGPVPDRVTPVPPGVGRIARPGTDVSIFTYGRMLGISLVAAERVRAHGVNVEVVDLRSIKPLDHALIVESLCRTGRGISVEESPVFGGVGAELAAIAARDAFDYLEAPFERLGCAERAIPCSPVQEAACFPTVETVVDVVLTQARY